MPERITPASLARRLGSLAIVIALLFTLLAAEPADAAAPQPLTVLATHDATIRSDTTATNFGSATTLQADGQPDRDLLVRFDIDGIDGRQVTRATLRLHGVDPSKAGGTFALTSSAWNEGTVTWANAPPAQPGTVGSIGTVVAGNWYELDLTSIVTADGSLSLRASSANTNGVDYASSEAGAALAPRLVIELSGAPPPPDTTAPTTPANLRTTGVSASQVGLAWDAASDDVGVTAYELTRDGVVLATVTAPTTAYLDSSVAANTTYTYAVRVRDAAGNLSPFSTGLPVTTPATSMDPVLVGAGDIADCGGQNDEATAALLDGVAGTVFTAGDNAYPSGSADDFANCYDPSWGRHLARTQPAAGNHEYQTPGASAYFSYFGASAGDPTTGYYSYDLDTWHVVVLNSNCAEVGGCGAGSAQEQWLRADLAASPRQNIVAVLHHPRYTSGTRGQYLYVQPLWQALYDFGAELVISGHDHFYERFAPLDPSGNAGSAFGIRQFVVGTGGAALSLPGSAIPHSEIRASAHGVLQLTLAEGSYTWQFLPTANSTFTDAGTAAVHARPPGDTTPPAPPAGLSATAAGATRVDLQWSASTDNLGVIGYEIERNGAAVATVPAVAQYADMSVSAGQTYTYRVRARDGAGNWSNWSAPATATTDTPPATLVFVAAEDATVRPDQPTANFGAEPTLLVDASSEKDFLMKFVVTGTGGRTITSARLRIYCVNLSDNGGEFYTVASTWSESAVAWNTAPTLSGSPLATVGPVSASAWYEIDLAAVIAGDGTYSVRISSPSTDGADYVSSEGAGGLHPVLTITMSGP